MALCTAGYTRDDFLKAGALPNGIAGVDRACLACRQSMDSLIAHPREQSASGSSSSSSSMGGGGGGLTKAELDAALDARLAPIQQSLDFLTAEEWPLLDTVCSAIGALMVEEELAGTCVAISKTVVISCLHCLVEDAHKCKVVEITRKMPAIIALKLGSSVYPLSVVHFVKDKDLAYLRCPVMIPCHLVLCDKVHNSTFKVTLVSFPAQTSYEGTNYDIAKGHVTGSDGEDEFYTDFESMKGSSGGAVVCTMSGFLYGMNTGIVTDSESDSKTMRSTCLLWRSIKQNYPGGPYQLVQDCIPAEVD